MREKKQQDKTQDRKKMGRCDTRQKKWGDEMQDKKKWGDETQDKNKAIAVSCVLSLKKM